MNPTQTLRAILDLILPPRCIVTGDIVDISGMLSPTPWKDIDFIDRPYCSRCGLPFDFVAEEDMVCGNCLDHPPYFDLARSALIYNNVSRGLILAFKHGDRLQLAGSFSQWMRRSGQDILSQTDIIAPVPLHRKRLWQRRYNQSAVLGKSIAKHYPDITHTPRLLLRMRPTPPQKGLTKKERLKNLTGAISILSQGKNSIEGKSICVIDDVYTSGATINECAKVLKKAGAKNVYALTLARVLL